MRVLVLWSHPSGYIHACLNELAKSASVTALMFHPSDEAPFDPHRFTELRYKQIWLDSYDSSQAIKSLADSTFSSADICLISGWHHPFYLNSIVKNLPSTCVRVLCFDWQWISSFRNYLKALYGVVYKSKLFDAAFVPGERQFQFAIRVGFPSERIFTGLYAADTSLVGLARSSKRLNQIVFVGRLVPEKGCDALISAWHSLQLSGSFPSNWSLHVYGTGPLRNKFTSLPNCECHGFTQPEDLARALGKAKILVAPSQVEPWGLQIHEATCAGLVVIASNVCGSSVHLVRPGFNGDLIPSCNPASLADSIKGLVHCCTYNPDAFDNMSRNSLALSRQFSPSLWADVVHSIYASLSNSKIKSMIK